MSILLGIFASMFIRGIVCSPLFLWCLLSGFGIRIMLAS